MRHKKFRKPHSITRVIIYKAKNGYVITDSEYEDRIHTGVIVAETFDDLTAHLQRLFSVKD